MKQLSLELFKSVAFFLGHPVFSLPSRKNIEINQSVFGAYIWVSFGTKSVCRFLYFHVLVCAVLLYLH